MGPLTCLIFNAWARWTDDGVSLHVYDPTWSWVVVLALVSALAVRYASLLAFVMGSLPGGVWTQSASGKVRKSLTTDLFGAAQSTLKSHPFLTAAIVLVGVRNPLGVVVLIGWVVASRQEGVLAANRFRAGVDRRSPRGHAY